ncbi:MAG: hypothetical protein R6U40_10815 [Desulfobacterales bacterium]
MCGKQHRISKGLLPVSLLCIVVACAYQQPPLQPGPEKLPSPVEIKSETPVAAPGTPASEIPVPAPSEPSFYLHKVRWPEETLSHIAKWYTGKIDNWKAIVEANPELDPKYIDIGDMIPIPEDLLTLRKPMPRSFLSTSVQKKSVSNSSPKKLSTPLKSTKLFGPIESEPPSIEPDSAELFGPVEIEQYTVKPDATKLFGPIE